jgi:hypothetical protein
MNFIGGAMMVGMVFGAGVTASKSGSVESSLRDKIGQIQLKTTEMSNSMKQLASREGTLKETAALDATNSCTAIQKLKDASDEEVSEYFYNEKQVSIYGIIFVMSVSLFLLSKLLLPKWKDIKNL